MQEASSAGSACVVVIVPLQTATGCSSQIMMHHRQQEKLLPNYFNLCMTGSKCVRSQYVLKRTTFSNMLYRRRGANAPMIPSSSQTQHRSIVAQKYQSCADESTRCLHAGDLSTRHIWCGGCNHASNNRYKVINRRP
jgi:hypothetical protein